ncbi:MAG: DNA translocase FtsK [Chloroflexota bacterium]|nr:DNA translocase FtsK [Chloroflexota bacterium]
MAKANTKTRSVNSNTSRNILAFPQIVLRIAVLVILAVAIAVLVFFRTPLVNILFETVGFGFILILIWIGAIAFIIWKRKWRSILTSWNIYLGAIPVTIAIWGILALIKPANLTIGDIEFATVSLGGTTGMYLIGNQGVGLHPIPRLALLITVSVLLFLPNIGHEFLKLLGQSAKATWLAMLTCVKRAFARAGQAVLRLYHTYPPHRLLAMPFIALIRTVRQPHASQPEITSAPTASNDTVIPEVESIPTLPEQKPIATEEKQKSPPTPVPLPREHDTAETAQLPPITLLDSVAEAGFTEVDNERRARLIEESLASYGVEARVAQINPGPSVTQFGIEPGWDRKYKRVAERDAQGKIKLDKDGNPVERLEEVSKTRVKVERITALANNLALALASPNIRIEAPVPGKSLVGIEVPNSTTALVPLASVIESPTFKKARSKSKLTLALGQGAAGEPVSADLAKMPHLLIAGATGSGKTVCINSIVTCLLMNNLPQDVRLLLIDPKRVELVSFDGVPHLISSVIVEVPKAIDALRRTTQEMDNRYKKFSTVGVRNIDGYNRSPLITEPMPYMVVIIDELADLMMTAAEVVEPSICRLAQLARATGIHLIIATQRPSVDVVTGLIKANFPTRIAFAMASLMDSRTILDTGGAEKLLGRGDMLYLPPEISKPKRLRGCFVSDDEISKVVNFWLKQRDTRPSYQEDAAAQEFASLVIEEIKDEDPMLVAARRLAKDTRISTSLIQRRLHIGYPRAARIMDALENEGIVNRSERGSLAEAVEADEENL